MPSTLKTENFFLMLMVAYVHIEYSTQNFQENRRGEGWNQPPLVRMSNIDTYGINFLGSLCYEVC